MDKLKRLVGSKFCSVIFPGREKDKATMDLVVHGGKVIKDGYKDSGDKPTNICVLEESVVYDG